MMRYIHEVEGGMNFLFKGVRRRIERRDASPPSPRRPTFHSVVADSLVWVSGTTKWRSTRLSLTLIRACGFMKRGR